MTATYDNTVYLSDQIFKIFSNPEILKNFVSDWDSLITSVKEEKDECGKGENNNMFDFGNMFNGMFKPVAKGYCKMGMNGQVAVKTATGYKTFNPKTRRLTNCDSFAFDMDGAFWVVPTFKLAVGDIILVNGKPRAVIEVNKNSIKTFSYEDSTIAETVPEHHVFMGKSYCYGKIFSPFMNMSNGDASMGNMMKMAMMSQMFGGNTSNGSNFGGMNPMMFMMMGKDNPMMELFDGGWNFGTPDEDDDDEDKDVKEDN